MRVMLDQRELKTMPLVEREIWLNANVLTIEFSLIGDLDLDLVFTKEFQSQAEARQSAHNFIKNNSDNNAMQGAAQSFDDQAILSKIMLFDAIVNKKLALPDDGNGFVCNGDIDYMESLLDKWKKQHRDIL